MIEFRNGRVATHFVAYKDKLHYGYHGEPDYSVGEDDDPARHVLSCNMVKVAGGGISFKQAHNLNPEAMCQSCARMHLADGQPPAPIPGRRWPVGGGPIPQVLHVGPCPDDESLTEVVVLDPFEWGEGDPVGQSAIWSPDGSVMA